MVLGCVGGADVVIIMDSIIFGISLVEWSCCCAQVATTEIGFIEGPDVVVAAGFVGPKFEVERTRAHGV